MNVSFFIAFLLITSQIIPNTAKSSNIVSESESSDEEIEFDENTLISGQSVAKKNLSEIITRQGLRDQEQKKNTVEAHNKYFTTAFECVSNPTLDKTNLMESLRLYIEAQLDNSFCGQIDLIKVKKTYMECLDELLDRIIYHFHNVYNAN